MTQCCSVSTWASVSRYQEKGDWFREPCGRIGSQPLSSHRASLSFSEKLFPICFLEFREGMECFSSWNFTPIKVNFQRASPTPFPPPALFFKLQTQGFSESGVLPLKHSRGFCWEVRKVLAVSSAAVGGSYCFKQGSDFCIMFCFQLWLSY